MPPCKLDSWFLTNWEKHQEAVRRTSCLEQVRPCSDLWAHPGHTSLQNQQAPPRAPTRRRRADAFTTFTPRGFAPSRAANASSDQSSRHKGPLDFPTF